MNAESRRPREASGSQTVIAATSLSVDQPTLTGIDRAIAGASDWDVSRFRAAVTMYARSGLPFVIEEVLETTGIDIDHPNRVGALTAGMAKAGIITRVGYRKARRPSRAGGVVAVWRGTIAGVDR